MSDSVARLAGLLVNQKQSGLTPGGWVFGDVLAAGNGVLQVSCDGLVLEAEDLGVPPELDHHWTLDTGSENLLRKGDRLVILVTADRQEHYILRKAVWA